MTTTIKLTPRGTVTLPSASRKQFALKANDILIVEATDQGILLKPAAIWPVEVYSDKRLAEFDKNNNADIAHLLPPAKKRGHRRA